MEWLGYRDWKGKRERERCLRDQLREQRV